MGLFSTTDKKQGAAFDPIMAAQGSLATDFGVQAGGASDRSGALWGSQGNLYDQIGQTLMAGGYNTPGVSYANERAELGKAQDWYKRMQGTPGVGETAMPGLTDEAGKPIATYGSIASGGSKYYSPEEEYAMRERPASQARSATSSVLDEMRRGGMSGWGGGGSGGALAAQKNLLGSLRSGSNEVNANLANKGAEYRTYGREGLERMQGNIGDYTSKIASMKDTPGSNGPSFGQMMAYMGADPRGSALDWSKMTNANLSGEGSALSGWGDSAAQQAAANKKQSLFSQIAGGLGAIGGGVAGAMTGIGSVIPKKKP